MGTNYNVSDAGAVRAGTTTNNVTIDSNGVILSGNARTTKLHSISCTELADGTSPPGTGFAGATFYRDFDPSTNEALYGHFVLPNDYESGTNLTVNVNWAPDNTDTGSVMWALTRDFTNDGDLITGATATLFLSAASGTTNAKTTASSTFSASAAVPGTNLAFIFSRAANNASDTFTGNARLLSLSIEYTANTI